MNTSTIGRRRLFAVVVTVLAMVTVVFTGMVTSVQAAPAPAALPDGVQIDAGGLGDGTFIADSYGTPGGTDTMPDSVTSFPNWGKTVPHPIPVSIWNTARFASTYTVPGLTPGSIYEVRLYFMDWYFKRQGQRVFDVAIDGTKVLTNFDIRAAAVESGADGGATFGVEKDFPVTVGASGTVVIDFLRGAADQPQVNAISIVPMAAAIPPALAVPAGNHQVLAAQGVGSQIYDCGADNLWRFREPAAILQTGGGAPIGLHYAGPTWQSLSDGSKVTGAASANVPSPNPNFHIPWLLLRSTSNTGAGVFGTVSYIQRLWTSGGVAPRGTCNAGTSATVPYSSLYVFWALDAQ